MGKRLLFITTGLSYGGAAKMLSFVAESLYRRGHNVHIANIGTTSKNDNRQSLPPEIVVHEVFAEGKILFRRIAQLRDIIAIAKNMGADVIIGFTMYPNIMAAIAAKAIHKKSIISERGDPYRTFDNSLLSKIIQFIINHASGAVFQTSQAGQFYSKRLQQKAVVIPNPIFVSDHINMRIFEQREKTVISVGRLDNVQKRYDVMIKAFAKFSEKHPDYTLDLYGNGPDESMVIAFSKELGIEDKVNIKGVTTESQQKLAEAGIFVITSDYEGISNSLLEAMSVGIPCVSTDHSPGGGRLLIKDHENGILVPIGDIDGISKALCEFAENKALAKSCGKKAEEVLVDYAPEKIIDMWERYVLSIG